MAAFNSIKKILSAMLICTGFVPVCSAGTDDILSGRELLGAVRDSSPTRGEKLPTVTELLDKYAETQDKLKSYILKAAVWTDYELRRDGQDGKGKIHVEIELRFDGSRRRLCCRQHMWMDEPWQGHNTPGDKPEYSSYVCEGNIWIHYVTGSVNEPGTVSFRIGKSIVEKMFKQNLSRGFGVPALRGFFVGDDERVDTVLRDAARVSLRERTERIGGSSCRVIDAETNRGSYTIWIDPRHGYNIAKAHVRIEAGDLFYGDYRLRKGERISGSLENVCFRLVNDRWIPVEADVFEIRETLPVGEGLQSKVHYKLKDVILNPDHDSLGSFVPGDINNGSKVYLNDGEYTWQNGKVVDAQGQAIAWNEVHNEEKQKEVFGEPGKDEKKKDPK